MYLRPVKLWAERSLPPDSVLRQLITGEADTIPADEFAAKVGEWLRILSIEKGG